MEYKMEKEKKKIKKAFRLTIGGVIFLFSFSIFHSVTAATITFDPQDTTVGTTTPFQVGINMDSTDPVNAFSLTFDVSPTVKIIGYSDGNSIVNLWIDQPHLVDARHLSLSGIIPGGYTGTGGRIITLSLQALASGPFQVSLDPASRAFLSGPHPVRAPLYSKQLALSAVIGKDNSPNVLPDTLPPVPFTPSLMALPGLGGERTAVIFATQDKGSGIARYDVAESWSDISSDDADGLSSLPWRAAESPYVLTDQNLTSYIYVRAVDGEGNQRVEIILPAYPRPWYERPQGYILIALFLCLALYALIFKKHTKRRLR